MSRNPGEIGTKSCETMQLGDFVFMLETNELVQKSGEKPALRNQSAELLAYLARRPGQLVSKDEMVAAIWKDTFVTDDSLVQCIADIRRALDDSDRQIVETLVGRGYRLNAAEPKTKPQLVDEIPRVAVLPFEDGSAGPNRGYLSDAIADEVITELAHFGEFSVVSRLSSFKFRGGELGAGAIGSELGAQYIVEGSQQVIGGKLRVSVRLNEVATETNLWTTTFDGAHCDDIKAQTEIIRIIAASVGFQICKHAPTLIEPEYHGAMYNFLASGADVQMPTQESLWFAEELNQKAVKSDPKSPYGYIGLCYVNLAKYLNRWTSGDPKICIDRAAKYGDMALALSPRNSQAHFARGEAHLAADELDHAERRLLRSIALNPHAPHVHASYTCLLFFRGETKRAIKQIEGAMQSNPGHPDWFFAMHAATLRQDQQYEAALATFQNMATVPGSNHMQLAAILVGLDRQDEARAAMQEFLKKTPHHTVERERKEVEGKFVQEEHRNLWLSLIRRAGLPE